MQNEFRYISGHVVRIGDRVRTFSGMGTVRFIIYPGTELAEAFKAPEGGVFVQHDGQGPYAGHVFTPSGDWEDFDLVERAGEGGETEES